MVVVLTKHCYWCLFGNDEQSMERGKRETLTEGGKREGKDEEASHDCCDGVTGQRVSAWENPDVVMQIETVQRKM